ncbi:hypothetical protein KM734_gp1 [Betapolyomavirus callosciuri]|uniref:Uncharacterized protein n=1 Tax=Betapolyomavirus callosciuri TaxID=2721749 RepID=A0A6G9LUM5_9POLY|nr:hypothetical protein KM734_gp1 [Betapolyomavirus callosciuri]QIQ69377.1 hypothetical protein [Betapolyomavirus callosciuri]QIQ69383.1 hypothetical protein [Betapolyomavirus callosciuri]QIQ69389.1 hypothetical protein [Betapolyomavirus callosciuri]
MNTVLFLQTPRHHPRKDIPRWPRRAVGDRKKRKEEGQPPQLFFPVTGSSRVSPESRLESVEEEIVEEPVESETHPAPPSPPRTALRYEEPESPHRGYIHL